MVASMESKQTYYILHTRYSNSKIGIDLLYIRTHFVWWHRLHYRATLVCNLPTSILVNVWVRFMTFHTPIQFLWQHDTTYLSSFDWSTLIFCSLTSPTCCNSSPRCTPVKCKSMQKAEFPIDSRTFSFPHRLADTSAWSKLQNNIEDFQEHFEKKRTSVSIKN